MAASSPQGKLIVGYWSIRGLGAPLRMMCEFAGADYEAVNYDAKPKEGGGWDTSDWFDKKPALKEKNALMNLPYVIDGEHTIAQTNACFAHLGRVLGLYGSNYAETLKVEQCLCQVMDLRNDAVTAFYSPAPEDNWVSYLAGSPKSNYGKFETWLEQNGTKYLACDSPTAPDFHLFEMIDQHEFLAQCTSNPSPLEGFPLLTAYYAAFKEIPQIATYLGGDLAKLPINNKMASFGAKPDGSAWS